MKEELRAQYIKSLHGRIDNIKTFTEKYREGSMTAEQNIRLLAHSLHGSGATFGFPEISQASATVEQASTDELLSRLDELLAVLEKVTAGNVVPGGETPEQTEKVAPEKPKDGKHVLIIEQDPDVVTMIAESLKNQTEKIHALLAKNAQQAEQQLNKSHFDLVIMDLLLPDKDGREILRQIKIDFQMKLPVIVLSGINKDLVRVDCMSLGADRYITKPFDPAMLTREIGKLLAGTEGPSLSLVPTDEEVMAVPEKPTATTMSLKGKTILVVDDDPHLGELVTHLMVDQGAKVKYVSGGREALEFLQGTPCSLVILDVSMPDIDGFQVLEKIRGELDMKGLPVILLTALGGEADIIRGFDLGANDYIHKPFSEVYLVARVKSLLKHHS